MAWTLTTSLDDFLSEAGEFLAAHPVENTVLLTVVDRLRELGPDAWGAGTPRFGWWQSVSGSAVAGAFVQTPPFGPVLGRMGRVAAAYLVDALRADGGPVATVSGEKATAEAFGWVWGNHSGAKPTVRSSERLYRLGVLAIPDPAPAGRPRVAATADRELLVSWFHASRVEINAAVTTHNGVVVDHRTAEGSLLVWEDEAGRPVSFAAVSPVLAGMSRIGPVFTPTDLRRQGYASAVVAAASAHALAQGTREVLVYTDLANPTGNSIFQKLGYRPVQDDVTLDLTD